MNTGIPNGARIYDYMLGGKDNFEADRQAAEAMLAQNPQASQTARDNRAFLGRAVRYLVEEAGIRQFLDIGTGLPTQQNVHEVAQACAPGVRVVYVDHDPMVVIHARALLATDDDVKVVEADLRRPRDVLDNPITRGLLDFEQPVAVLMAAILHFVSDEEDPGAILAEYRRALAPGSHLLISHTADESPEHVMATAKQGFRLAGSPLTPRKRSDIAAFFGDFELVEPGLTDVRSWRAPQADLPALPWVIVGGVGRKP
ncbi:SAM-dependent methyltransferase [Thermoactinospora rubra]|uniref:SAM-dependent methyltransferase n=1 Tax=Thermoactinospora rubra TaxID=1088767 RepID=UPI001F0A3767|nr:SAM-dependent methyltransferase [Thermoactinospora rubra]